MTNYKYQNKKYLLEILNGIVHMYRSIESKFHHDNIKTELLKIQQLQF